MEWLWWVGGAVGVLLAIDRVFTALEDHGHMFWRRRRPRSGRGSTVAGGALGGLVEAFQPNYQYVVAEQERQRSDVQQDEDGAPPHGIDLETGSAYLRARRTPTDPAPRADPSTPPPAHRSLSLTARDDTTAPGSGRRRDGAPSP